MANKRKFTSWWKNQSTAIKVAVIAGIFSLLVGFCGSSGTIVAVFANHYLSNTPARSVETYTLHRNNLHSIPSILFTKMYDEDYSGAVPTSCVRANYGNISVEQFETNPVLSEAQKQSFAFDLISNQPLIITEAELVVLSYISPPPEETLKGITFYDPPGMGDVPTIFFSETNIKSSTKKLIITRQEGSLRLDSGDAVTLVIPLIFLDAGLYSIQFNIHGQLDLGRLVNFTSETYSYGWMYINNITQLPINGLSGTKMRWIGDCP